MSTKPIRIHCTACGETTLVKTEPVFEGFSKIGEQFRCVGCGHVYAHEDGLPLAEGARPSIFSESDRSGIPDIFKDEERGKNCRYCEHYTVNPFTQRCGLHNREVQATDSCPDFTPKPDDEE